MKYRFGFIVSDTLEALLVEARDRLEKGENKKDPMYPYRNRLIEQVNQELIDNLMIKQAQHISNTERREGMIKLGHTIQKITGKIVRTMLSKDKDSVVMQSKAFLDDSVARDQDGNLRMGMAVPAEYFDSLMTNFSKIMAGELNPEILGTTQQNLKQFDSYLLEHYMIDFCKTLGWGMIKLNLAKGAKSAVAKANQVMIDQMMPKMKLEELQEVAPHMNGLFFESDQVGSSFI